MPLPKSFTENRTLPYRPSQIFDVVADISKYPEFVPWCVSTRKVPSKPSSPSISSPTSLAPNDSCATLDTIVEHWEMSAGFKVIKDSYLSKVILEKDTKITAEAIDAALFKHLKTEWSFSPVASSVGIDENQCTIDFKIEFEFGSYLYAYFANMFFMEVATKMVSAFIDRCDQIYKNH